MKRLMLSVIAAMALFVPQLGSAAVWSIDPEHSTVQFKVRHLMVSNVKGNFEKFSGSVDIDEKDITRSRVQVTIDAASIDTRVVKRDEHLRSADFLDAARFPTLSFISKRVERAGADRLKVAGVLTIRGVSRDVVLDVEGPSGAVKDPWGNTKSGASASTTINRKDFGLTWNKALETGGVVVGDEVLINIEVELQRK
jgi:polyisoprenoid-binding protein YceI